MSESETPKSESHDATFARARELQGRRAFAEAADIYRRLAREVLTMNLALALGLCLTEIGAFSEADYWLGVAKHHRPEHPGARRLLGNLYAAMGRMEEAELELRTALALGPDDATRLNLASLLLSVGRYAEGWPLMEARVTVHPNVVPPIRLSYPQWQGEPLAGKSVLVWYEQGLGDQIQMCRFARTLKERGAAHVSLGCRPALVELFRTVPGADEVIPAPRKEAVTVGRHDYWTRYFSLPALLGITMENLPARPYLSAPADRRGRWAGLGRVGLVWRSSPTGFNAKNKNVPDELAQRLLDLGARSLHPEDTGVADFADTAAIIEDLDLVISIDTSVAHLAGAMGKPCWTLLPYLHCDWRWLRDRSDSPWYPSMRLYRQTAPSEWAPVIDRVALDLEVWRQP